MHRLNSIKIGYFSFFDPRTQESDTSCLEILAAVLMQLHIREIEAFQPGDKFLGRGEDSLGSSCDKIPRRISKVECVQCASLKTAANLKLIGRQVVAINSKHIQARLCHSIQVDKHTHSLSMLMY